MTQTRSLVEVDATSWNWRPLHVVVDTQTRSDGAVEATSWYDVELHEDTSEHIRSVVDVAAVS